MVLKNKNTNIPLVTVCVQTYQHAPFIRECLDGILMQKTNFPIEINLGEDESTDGTRDICIEYAQKYPDIINLFLNERKNVIYIDGLPSGRGNFINNIKNARGKYIALCAGDDYWTDPHKLQKQVDFLEKNPKFSMCFHDALLMNNNKLTEKKILDPFRRHLHPLEKSVFDPEDTLNPFASFAPTASILFRNNLLTPFPDWFYSCSLGDRMIFSMLSKHGKIKYLDFVGSVRRIQPTSITLTFTVLSSALNRIIFYKNMPSYIGEEYKPLCDRYIKFFYEQLIYIYFSNKSDNCSYPISILKGLRYLLSPSYLSLLNTTSIKNDLGWNPFWAFRRKLNSLKLMRGKKLLVRCMNIWKNRILRSSD